MNAPSDFALRPNLTAAQGFLTALDPKATRWTFQTFDDNADRKDKSLARVLNGTLQEHAAQLDALQKRGAGVFVTVNETDLNGREEHNIIRVRAAFLDLDGAPIEPVIAWEMPHIIVDSSARRFHAYWLVDGLALDRFTPMQEKLIAAFDGDKVKDLPRVMRLPGFWHQKVDSKKGLTGTPCQVQMRETGAFPAPFPAAEFLAKVEALAPPLPLSLRAAPAIDMGPRYTASTEKRTQAEVDEALSYIPADLDYHEWLRVLMALHDEFGEAGRSLADEWSAKGTKYRHGEVAAKFRSFKPGGGITIGTVFELARQNGANLSDLGRKQLGRDAPAAEVPAAIQAPARTSRFFSAAKLQGLPVPPREWLVEALIPMRTVTLLSGDGGTGKSLLALQLAAAIAAGRPWLGRTPRPGGAIYLSAEDDEAELHRRLDDIGRGLSIDYGDLSRLTLRSLAGEDALLAVETTTGLMQTALMEELDKRAAHDKPVAVVLDTSADLYGGNENDRAAVRRFIGFLRGLALRHGCAVMLLSHPSLTGMSSGSGLSGSTAWNNSVRSRLYMQRVIQDSYEADPDKRVLTTMKANYGRVGAEIQMTWRDGVFVADEAPTGLDAMAGSAKGERVFLRLLDDFTAQGRRVNAASGPGYAPKMFAGHPESEGMTKPALVRAMEALLQRGTIEVGHVGPPSRRVSYIKRRGAE